VFVRTPAISRSSLQVTLAVTRKNRGHLLGRWRKGDFPRRQSTNRLSIQRLSYSTIELSLHHFMSNKAEKSTTPILDLETALPLRRSRVRSQAVGFLFGLTSTLVFLVIIGRDSEHLGPLSFILFFTIFAAILVHEGGHLVAGRIVGFHFNSIHVAWFSFGLQYGKLTFRVSREMTAGGYASIQIDRIYRLRRRLMFFISGGPAASILSVLVAVAVVNTFNLHSSWLAMPAACLAFVSLLFSMVALLPAPGYRTDGARLEMLFTSRDKSRRWFCLAALTNQHRLGKSPKLWNANWVKTAASVRDSSKDEIAACWLAYISFSARKQPDLAAEYLERCLTLAGLESEAMRDTLILEASTFQAWERNDADKSVKWLSLIKSQKRIPRLMQLRNTIAMNCANRNFESAYSNWREGLSLIEKLPPTPVRDLLSASWADWMTEIRERQEPKPRQ